MLLDRASEMKPEQLYHELRNVADRLGLVVLEHNFRTTGIRVRSGFCKVKNQSHCIIDKHLRAGKKAEVLAECLMYFPHDTIYVLPAVREYMDTFKPRNGLQEEQPAPETKESGENLR